MSAGTALAVYLVGLAIIWILVLVALRGEPTAHGQIVGRQIGCLVAVLWPLALVYFICLSPFMVAAWLERRRAERGA